MNTTVIRVASPFGWKLAIRARSTPYRLGGNSEISTWYWSMKLNRFTRVAPPAWHPISGVHDVSDFHWRTFGLPVRKKKEPRKLIAPQIRTKVSTVQLLWELSWYRAISARRLRKQRICRKDGTKYQLAAVDLVFENDYHIIVKHQSIYLKGLRHMLRTVICTIPSEADGSGIEGSQNDR